MQAADSTAALARTTKWWHEYWDRSWIITDAGQGIEVPANRFPLRVGFDSNQQNKFPGELVRTSTFSRAFSSEDIARLAAAGHDQPSPISVDSNVDFSKSFTLEAWIKPDHLAAGRIFDKMTAGGSDGFIFDTNPGDTLRIIFGGTTLVAKPKLLTAGEWHHAAATV